MQLGIKEEGEYPRQPLRALSSDELKAHSAFEGGIMAAKRIMGLFPILRKNYEEWENFLLRLLNANFDRKNEIGERAVRSELARLLLNYFSAAYAIQEGFNRQIKNASIEGKPAREAYKELLDKISSFSPEFAFGLDYRGYLQHVGVGVGKFSRTVSASSVAIRISECPKDLWKASKDWKKSKLSASDPDIDLIHIMRGFHVRMLGDYATFVAKHYYVELREAHDFYERLTVEARQMSGLESGQMVFVKENYVESEITNGTRDLRISGVEPPNFLFSELGINVGKE